MALNFQRKPPAWFWIVAVVLLLWGAMGCFAAYTQITSGPEAWGDPQNAEYNRRLYASLPAWYNWVYGLAVGTALVGAIALLMRRAVARPIFVVSVIAVVVQFGYAFLATDLIAHKGVATTVPFPLFVLGVALFSVWFAGLSRRRGWLN